jgi:PD-(D/E)XK nuclease superfamily
MQKLNFNLSASTINTFCTCPWVFKCDKIDKRPSIQVPSIPLVFGQALHKLLEHFYKLGTFNTRALFENWDKFFDIEVKIQNAQKLELKFAKATGYTMLKNWVAMAKDNEWLHNPYLFDDGRIGIELEFMLPYSNDRFEIDVHGYMDLVIEVNGKLYILDWKSGKHSEDKYKLQAILYSWALYKKYGLIDDCVKFVHPSKKENKIVDVVVKDEDYRIVSKKVNEMFDAIEDNYFKKSNGDHCKWCGIADCVYNVNESLKLLLRQNND